MLVPIYSRTQTGLRIVYMNRNETIATDDAIEFSKCCSHSRFAANVVTRREKMRGVEAYAQSFRLAHVRNDMRDMLETMTDARTLASCNLQSNFRFHFWNYPKYFVD